MALIDICSHTHPLKLVYRKQIIADTIPICGACQEPADSISDFWFYICTKSDECNYFMHKLCADLPLDLDHASHSLHPLTLKPLQEDPESYTCDACGNSTETYIYRCDECSFNLDIVCASVVRRTFEHRSHRHPLVLNRKETSSFCNGCGDKHSGLFYCCNTCVVFSIHRDCASLVDGQVYRSHAGHPLRLVYSDHFGIYFCLLCYQRIENRRSWFFECRGCKFYAHIYCVVKGDDKDEQKEVEGLYPDIPRLAWGDAEYEFGIVGLLNRGVPKSIENGNNGEDKQAIDNEPTDIIDHFSHPEHSLFLQQETMFEEDPYSNNEIPKNAKCNGCTRRISAPFYHCKVPDCDFFLHKSCALVPDFLPQHAAHMFHDGMILQKQPWSETRVFECSCCWEYCNGFSYRCQEELCGFEVDLECAFLPSTIIHKSHSFHPLALENTSASGSSNDLAKLLKCCLSQRGGPVAYRCTNNTCDYQIHVKCSMLPGKIWHIFDRDEPFKLAYSHSVIEPANNYYCEICEKDLDPKLWFYYTSSCHGQVMHPRCLSSLDGCPNPSFKTAVSKSIYRREIHRHDLYVSPCDMKWCHHCEQDVEPLEHLKDREVGVAYKCWWTDCDFVLQMRCALKLNSTC